VLTSNSCEGGSDAAIRRRMNVETVQQSLVGRSWGATGILGMRPAGGMIAHLKRLKGREFSGQRVHLKTVRSASQKPLSVAQQSVAVGAAWRGREAPTAEVRGRGRSSVDGVDGTLVHDEVAP